MAADAAAMRQAFTRLGFTQEAATSIVDVQGIDSLDELRKLMSVFAGSSPKCSFAGAFVRASVPHETVRSTSRRTDVPSWKFRKIIFCAAISIGRHDETVHMSTGKTTLTLAKSTQVLLG